MEYAKIKWRGFEVEVTGYHDEIAELRIWTTDSLGKEVEADIHTILAEVECYPMQEIEELFQVALQEQQMERECPIDL